MKFTSVFTALTLALLSAFTAADIKLNSFPSTVYIGGFYTLSWTATGNYSYTFWLVVESSGNTYANEFQWLKQQSLDSGLHYSTLTPSYTWTVPNNLNQQSHYALWIDGLAIPFDGESYTNITNWFQIVTPNTTASSTTSSSTSSSSSSLSSTSSSLTSATHSTTQSTSATPSGTSSGASSVSTSGTATAAAATAPASSEHHSSLSGGAIAGIVIGIVVLIALLVGAAIFTVWRRRRTALQNREAAARANRLEPVMSEGSYEMQQRSPQATA